MKTFLYWLTGKLPARAIDGEHGEPYLERYFLFRLLGLQAYIHRFVASDPDRGMHDHPWGWSLSLVLVGGYRETRHGSRGWIHIERFIRPWQFNFIRGSDFHRVALMPGREAWTLFIHGPRTKGWGFLQRNGSYTPFADNENDYPKRAWWRTAPCGRCLRTVNKEWKDKYHAAHSELRRAISDLYCCREAANSLRASREANAQHRLNDFVTQAGIWADATFAPDGDYRGSSIVAHLKKEVAELAENPRDMEEIADCFLLLCHLVHQNKGDLQASAARKLEINKKRKWGKPDADGVVEHIRDDEVAP